MPATGDTAPLFTARPVFGLPVDLKAQVQGGPVLLVFVRSLASPVTRALLARLQAAFPRLDERGVRVVAVTTSALEPARDFVPRYHVLFPVICDPTGELFRRFDVPKDGPGLALLRCLPGLPNLSAALSLGHGRPEPAAWGQRPACYLLDRGGDVVEAWVGSGVWDLPDLAHFEEAACSRS